MRSPVRAAGVFAALTLLGPVACREQSSPAEIEVPVGRQRVAAQLPAGWRFVEVDGESYFQRSGARIRLADLGPATGFAVVDELERVRTLHRRGRWEEVRAAMADLPIRRLLRDESRWQAIEDDWKRVAWLRVDDGVAPEVRVEEGLDPRVERAIDRLVALAAEIPERDLETIARDALERLADETLHEVSAMRPLEIAGRPAIRIETRDRLSHRDVREHLFVVDRGRLLALHTLLGDPSTLSGGFEVLVQSLDILP